MVYADADGAVRSQAHERLAEAVDDPVERARHLALARLEPDETLAATLEHAAAVARHRGAPAIAADLATLAADRTPDVVAGSLRRFVAAQYAEQAGMIAAASRLAHDSLRHATDPEVRVRLRLLLIDLAGQDYSQVGPLLEAAYADAGSDPRLGAKVRMYRGRKAHYDGDDMAAFAEFEWAKHLAEVSGADETLVEALAYLAITNRGAPNDESVNEALLARAAALSESLPLTQATINVRQLNAVCILRRGDVETALSELESLRAAVERGGSVSELVGLLTGIASSYTRAGRFADALVVGRICMRMHADLEVTPGPGLLVGAIAELHGGTLAAATHIADAAVAACLAAGDEPFLRWSYACQGQVLLLQGDPAGAIESMRLAYAIEQRRGIVDPGMYMWHADFIEALVGAGSRTEAARVLAELTAQVEDLGRDNARLGLARASGLLTAADGDPRAGAAEITDALRVWGRHPFPLEIARAWHALGTIERRAHRRGAAREAFAEAARRYEQLGAVTWAAAADSELAKLNGPRGMGLSETEQRIVDLVRRGATNREIARSTFLSVKAIEANLTRLYRRFGVRNREQLSRAMAELSAD
jgi:DNA-binding CsgD family transcriptional regulator